MTEKAKLIPRKGLLVRDPVTGQPLPDAGAKKPLNSYWLRRLRVGDVHRGSDARAAAPAGGSGTSIRNGSGDGKKAKS